VLVRDVVSGAARRYRTLLLPSPPDERSGGDNPSGAAGPSREPAPDLFSPATRLSGEPVLLVDDTWATGARAQSAAAALKAAGAGPVGVVVIGRWIDAGYRDNDDWLQRVQPARWSWQRCCLELTSGVR